MVEPVYLYYVQDNRTFTGNCVTWWSPEGHGYTNHIYEAGKFKADEREWRETDVLWPVELIDKLWRHHIDMQDLRNHPPFPKP